MIASKFEAILFYNHTCSSHNLLTINWNVSHNPKNNRPNKQMNIFIDLDWWFTSMHCSIIVNKNAVTCFCYFRCCRIEFIQYEILQFSVFFLSFFIKLKKKLNSNVDAVVVAVGFYRSAANWFGIQNQMYGSRHFCVRSSQYVPLVQ